MLTSEWICIIPITHIYQREFARKEKLFWLWHNIEWKRMKNTNVFQRPFWGRQWQKYILHPMSSGCILCTVWGKQHVRVKIFTHCHFLYAQYGKTLMAIKDCFVCFAIYIRLLENNKHVYTLQCIKLLNTF